MSPAPDNPIILLDPGDARRRAIMQGVVPDGQPFQKWGGVGMAWPGGAARRHGELIDRALRSATKGHRGGLKRRVLAAQTRSIERRLDSLSEPHCFLVWNGLKGHRGILTGLARAAGHRVIQFEEAPLPGRLQISSLGINGDLPLPRDPDFYHGWCAHNAPATDEDVLAELRSALAPRPARHKGVDQISGTGRLPAEPFLFCPLQVPGDSQLTLHGGAVRDMETLLSWLAEAARALPEGWHIRLKEHPSARISLREAIEAIQTDKLICDNATSSIDQMHASRGVITVNSSMGLQAMLIDKPVIVLGHAFWAFAPLANPAPGLTDLTAYCAHPATLGFDAEARAAFLRFLGGNLFPLEQDVVTKKFTLSNLMMAEAQLGRDMPHQINEHPS